MLTTETIRALSVALSDELASRGVLGEVGLCGGAVMCLVRDLELQSPAAVFEVICRYYPRARVPVKTAFFVEEILQE